MTRFFQLFLALGLLGFHSLKASAQTTTLDDMYANPGNLTDQQMQDAKTFEHRGLSQRIKDEKCKNTNCDPDKIDGSDLGDMFEENMGKAYTMLFGGLGFLTDGGAPKLSLKSSTPEPATTGGTPPAADTAAPKEGEKTNDYCLMTAMGWEMIVGMIQTNLNSGIEKETANIQDEQVRSLVALKKGHEARQSTSLMQSWVYGGVSLCYVGYGIAGGYTDPWLYARGLAATALTGLYISKYDRHRDAISAIDKIIKSLPDPGDCNPWTGTSCFCNESTSKTTYPSEYESVCVSKTNSPDIPPVNIGCGAMNGNQIMFDKECKCKETKTCFTTSIRPFNPNYNFGNNVMNYANQPFDQLESGSFNPAKLNNYSTDARALALKAFKTMKTKLPKPKLSATQQASANELAKVLPPEAAALMAAAPAGNSPVGLGMGRPVSLDKLSPETKKKVATAINSQYQSNGSGFDQASNDQENSFQMPTLGQKSSSEDNIEVLKFAEKAVDGADVNKAPETPIFDIISNRYRRSGWNKIESTEMKAQ